MTINELPAPSLVDWIAIPDLTIVRQENGGKADGTPATGWHIVFDLRDDGLTDGFVCERSQPDGTTSSVCWDARHLRAVYPPRTGRRKA